MKEEARTNEPTRISRRRFLMLIGGAVGASVLCCGGLATLGLRQPAIEYERQDIGRLRQPRRINWRKPPNSNRNRLWAIKRAGGSFYS
jgi:hypothetical protein